MSTLGTNTYVNLVGKERLLAISLTTRESVMLRVFTTTNGNRMACTMARTFSVNSYSILRLSVPTLVEEEVGGGGVSCVLVSVKYGCIPTVCAGVLGSC